MNEFDVIVVGAGHAGIEAALASARMGLKTACVTMRLDRIGHLPCNCSIGGPAKGHMAREVDALGGQMAVTTDYALTHIRRVGTSRGPAVQTVRAHVCKELYPQLMQQTMGAQPNLTLIEGVVETVLSRGGKVVGIRLAKAPFPEPLPLAPSPPVVRLGSPKSGAAGEGGTLHCRAVVLTTGTFLNGLCHEGQKKTIAARHGDQAATSLSDFLKDLGIHIRRFKTGTTPRIRYSSIDFTKTEEMESEPEAGPVSFLHTHTFARQALLPCWQTHTTKAMHDLIRERLHESAMYSGQIQGVGPRYCPSIEDKIVKFADKDSHPIFFEVEDWNIDSVYVQGVSTSLPAETQIDMLRQVPGLEKVEMIRPGYAVEYDMADPLQLTQHLMSKLMDGLFLAGQVNGTSGYEEAAGQGIVAGINAARWASDQPPVDFTRDQSFIGVMIDDLVTKGVDDPYRMLTARAEHRLLLRHDNADTRLTPLSRAIGLCQNDRWVRFSRKQEKISEGTEQLKAASVSIADQAVFEKIGLVSPRDRLSLFELMRRPEIGLEKALEIGSLCGQKISLDATKEVREQIELAAIYEGYLIRQTRFRAKSQKLDELRIPRTFDFESMKGLSYESKEKLSKVRPTTIGQASRVPGVRMSDVALLIGHLKAKG